MCCSTNKLQLQAPAPASAPGLGPPKKILSSSSAQLHSITLFFGAGSSWQPQWIFTHSWAQIWRIQHKMVSSRPVPVVAVLATFELSCPGPAGWLASSRPSDILKRNVSHSSTSRHPSGLFTVRPSVCPSNDFSLERLSRWWWWLSGVSVSG